MLAKFSGKTISRIKYTLRGQPQPDVKCAWYPENGNSAEVYTSLMSNLAADPDVYQALLDNDSDENGPNTGFAKEASTKQYKVCEAAGHSFYLGSLVNAPQFYIYLVSLRTVLNKAGIPFEFQFQLGKSIRGKKSAPEKVAARSGAAARAEDGDTAQQTLIELIRGGQYNLILNGAPGTGKTYTSDQVALHFIKSWLPAPPDDDEDSDAMDEWNARLAAARAKYIERVQFHPSFDYTDFVEGLRPVDGGDGKLSFRRRDGIFMQFCRKVVWDNQVDHTERLHFFLIDEINRADLSKVLGELMFCLESDKRGPKGAVRTPYRNLATHFEPGEVPALPADADKPETAYEDIFNDGFYIPENVVVIGTMNDIDRSVESMDFALRRRFAWHEVKVTPDLLEAALSSDHYPELQECDPLREEIIGRVVAFNEELHGPDYGLTTGHDISQGYFTNLPEKLFAPLAKEPSYGNIRSVANGIMAWVWDVRVGPLIQEYLRGQDSSETMLDDLKAAWGRPAPRKAQTDAPDQSVPADQAEPAAQPQA